MVQYNSVRKNQKKDRLNLSAISKTVKNVWMKINVKFAKEISNWIKIKLNVLKMKVQFNSQKMMILKKDLLNLNVASRIVRNA